MTKLPGNIANKRVILLDGAMGTMLRAIATDSRNFPCEMHNLKNPSLVRDIHFRYAEAGADIICTNTFNPNSLSSACVQNSTLAEDSVSAAVHIARYVSHDFKIKTGKEILVAGTIGPTFDASLIPFLIDGGVDLLLFETVTDISRLKKSLDYASEYMSQRNLFIPVMVSATLREDSGKLLSGETLHQLIDAIDAYTQIMSVGVNCIPPNRNLKNILRELSLITDLPISVHPNAGLPDINGNYHISPTEMAECLRSFLKDGLPKIIGGCCGTTPDHISALRDMADSFSATGTPQEQDVP